MSLLSGIAATAPGASSALTISYSGLIAAASISDAYWSVSANWSAVRVIYADATDNQRKVMVFTADAAVANFVPSLTARANTWALHSVVLDDFDGGTYSIPRSAIASASGYDMLVSAGDTHTSLLLHFNSTLDSSSNALVTSLGSANSNIQTTVAKFGGALVTDSVAVNATSALDQAAGDFTIDCWFRFNSLGAYNPIYSYPSNSSGRFGTQVLLNNTGDKLIYFAMSNTGSPWDIFSAAPGSTSISANTWYHFAFVRHGSNFSGYINGVLDFSGTSSATLPDTSAVPLRVGVGADNFEHLNGYIDEFRYSNTARWTSAFTPPTSAYTPDANTMLLMHFDLPIDVDSSSNDLAVTLHGVAYNQSATSKFNKALSSGYASVAANAALDQSGGDFTYDCWFNLNNAAANQAIYSYQGNLSGRYGTGVLVLGAKMAYYAGSASGSAFDIAAATPGTTTIASNTWYHFAFVRNGSNFSGYINGVLDFTTTSSAALVNTTTLPLQVGEWADNSVHLNGFIDEFRFSKGIARWTAPFTPPTAAY